MADEPAPIAERGLLTASGEAWDLAVRRAEVIGPLARSGVVGLASADTAAAELGVSRRQVYLLLRRWREGAGVVSDLLPRRSSGGRGREHLPEAVEVVIREVLRRRYLTRQKPSVAAVHREIARACRRGGLPVPSRGTIERRIAKLDPVKLAAAREGPEAARALQPAGGTPPARGLLEQVQIDHTVVDVTVVDQWHRLPIGRPYVTVAIDTFSRCVVGLVVTLEAPSALSVGLCLAHTVGDKRAWLERLEVDAEWPMSGKPAEVYVDNAAEFKSEALRRGCDQHGITLDHRPVGQPHYGGIVERLVGTMMQAVHDELPGTTFSNPQQRGGYDSDAAAVLTVGELERWLALAVVAYHAQVHEGLAGTPAARWAEGVAAAGAPVTVTNQQAFLVDFLPVLRRTLRPTGFQVDHIRYFSDALKPWIARRERLDRFVLRRDPRDLSRVWVLDPAGEIYLEVPYRTLSHPPVNLWEHRTAVARLREQGRAQVDEDAVFRMVEQMRAITEAATATSRKARRDAQRRAAAPGAAISPNPPRPAPPAAPTCPDPDDDDRAPPAEPFAVIEEW